MDSRRRQLVECVKSKYAIEFKKGAHAVVVKNHGVIAGGMDIHHARAIVESLEEWAKILTVARIFGGVRDYYLD